MIEAWGQTPEGESIYRYQLRNGMGMTATILNFGAIVAELHVPVSRNTVNVVLGYSSAADYVKDTHFIGVVAGRYCNRIADACFILNDERFNLVANEGANQLHGGYGFSKRLWRCIEHSESKLVLELISKNGDQGYPGTLTAWVTYTLTEENELLFAWSARSTKDTVVSLTNHTYFNLSGAATIGDHSLQVALTHYTPIDEAGIPTGDITPVANTVFDLTSKPLLADCLTHESLKHTMGFDHNWCISAGSRTHDQAQLVAVLSDSVLNLNVYTTLPGLQCYTGNHLDGSEHFRRHQAICLESQYYPNAPNVPLFPSPILRAGDTMQHLTRFEFSQSS